MADYYCSPREVSGSGSELTLIKNVESFQIGNNAQIRFTTRDKIPQFDKSKTYYIIIAEAGPDPVPEFNR